MHLIEIFLPVRDNSGKQFPPEPYSRVRRELTRKFGGVTAFLRAPAVGLWQDERGAVRQDELVILEVMADVLDADWWADYRLRLEARFRQAEIVVRATPIQSL